MLRLSTGQALSSKMKNNSILRNKAKIIEYKN
jgi:hypothetical protein